MAEKLSLLQRILGKKKKKKTLSNREKALREANKAAEDAQ